MIKNSIKKVISLRHIKERRRKINGRRISIGIDSTNICNNNTDCYIIFDFIFYCVSEGGETIERIYIFPRNELIIRNGVGIDKNTTTGRGVAWYEKYMITDEYIIDNANNLWKKIRMKKQPGIN